MRNPISHLVMTAAQHIRKSATVAIALLACTFSWAQTSTQPGEPQTSPAARDAAPQQGAAGEREKSSLSRPLAIFRAPLLRESSEIIDAPAEVRRDERGAWVALIGGVSADVEPRSLTLLPCTRLAELQRIIEAAPERIVRFKLSGLVYVYRERNYLLPTHTPVILEDSVRQRDQTNRSAAENILRELDEAAGPQLRSDVGRSTGEGSAQPRSNASPDATSTGKAAPAARQVTSKSVREGALITNRRGKLTRDAGGAWLFVFDADAAGLADPPMRLLPCLLLERIEEHAKRRGPNAPAMLNGTVYVYAGQHYLLPTVFLIPQDRRNITP